MTRIYHPYTLWEEVDYNMWGTVEDTKGSLQAAIKFTSDHKLYGSFMIKVVEEWKYSCENALTDEYISKKAWIGHAAVALALKIPEHITRRAWGFLTDEQQLLANNEARKAIKAWEYNQVKNKGICGDVGGQMLLDWNP